MKKSSRFLALALAGIMTLSMAACGSGEEKSGSSSAGSSSEASSSGTGAAEGDNASSSADGSEEGLPEWLNAGGDLPIVKEGTEKTLTMAIRLASGNVLDASEQWFYYFIEEFMNIDIEVDVITNDEYLNLILSSPNNLPDVIINAQFETTDLVYYGDQEGMFIDMAPYITPELTPNLYSIYYEDYPEFKSVVSDAQGRIWSLGYINDVTGSDQIKKAFLNYDWLDEAELDPPETIDELLDVLRAFKKRGDDIVPMGGSLVENNPCMYLFLALGYITDDSTGLSIAIRNGEPVLPVADREAYGEFLRIMNTMHDEGLIDQDFYTLDEDSTNAVLRAERAGFILQAPVAYIPPENLTSWWAAPPLTSDYNDTPLWPKRYSSLNAGNFVITSACEEPELAMAFVDWLFDAGNCAMAVDGSAETQTEYLTDVVTGYTYDENGNIHYPYAEEHADQYISSGYAGQEIQLWGYKKLGMGLNEWDARWVMYGNALEDKPASTRPDLSGGGNDGDRRKDPDVNGDFTLALEDLMVPVLADDYPVDVYMTVEDAERFNYLSEIVSKYAIQETAKFVMGTLELNDENLNNYFDEVEKQGAAEMVEIYKKYYAD